MGEQTMSTSNASRTLESILSIDNFVDTSNFRLAMIRTKISQVIEKFSDVDCMVYPIHQHVAPCIVVFPIPNSKMHVS